MARWVCNSDGCNLTVERPRWYPDEPRCLSCNKPLVWVADVPDSYHFGLIADGGPIEENDDE
jgi:hypothetical protein